MNSHCSSLPPRGLSKHFLFQKNSVDASCVRFWFLWVWILINSFNMNFTNSIQTVFQTGPYGGLFQADVKAHILAICQYCKQLECGSFTVFKLNPGRIPGFLAMWRPWSCWIGVRNFEFKAFAGLVNSMTWSYCSQSVTILLLSKGHHFLLRTDYSCSPQSKRPVHFSRNHLLLPICTMALKNAQIWAG